MRTKVSRICDGVIEAGWLLAVIIVPLFFNVYSSRVFEPDKISLLRSIAMIMAVAWLCKTAEGWGAQRNDSGSSRFASWLRTPLMIPAILTCVVYIMATITSVARPVSWWGSYQRLQGTYTWLSYVVVFMLVVQNLRSQEQIDRLWTVVIVNSLPIAFYGIVQHYGQDPLPWGGDVSARVASNMGNAIFIAAYLIMVIPLTIARIMALLREVAASGTKRLTVGLPALYAVIMAALCWAWFALGIGRSLMIASLAVLLFLLIGVYLQKRLSRMLLLGAYGVILGIQLVCLIFSQSRGPILGILAGLFFFALFYLVTERHRKLALALIALSIVALGFLVVINLPNTPFESIKDVPYVGRLGQMAEVSGGTGKVRVLIWGGVVEMLKDNPARAVIGWGPEAMYVAYNPYYPPELANLEARNASPDRSHNETFDSVVTTGIIGFLVYIALFGMTFYYGLKYMGQVDGNKQKRLFIILCSLGAVAGAALAVLIEGTWRFVGVGLPMGFIGGVFAYVCVVTIGRREEVTQRSVSATVETALAAPEGAASSHPNRSLLISALMAAIVAHFVEIHFGIAIAATRTYFWAYAGLLVVLGENWIERAASVVAPEPAPVAAAAPKGRGKKKRKEREERASRPAVTAQRHAEQSLSRQVAIYGVLMAVILATVFWDYITNPLAETNAFKVIGLSFTTMAASRSAETVALGMLFLLLTSITACLAVPLAEIAESIAHRGDSIETDTSWWLIRLGRMALLAVLPALLYALIHASRVGPRTPVSDLIFEYAVALGILMIALVWALVWGKLKQGAFSSGALTYGYPLVLIAALVWNINVNLGPIKADVLYKQGLRYDQAQQWEKAIYFYERAIEAAPNEDFFRLFYGRAMMELAKTTEDEAQRDALFQQALAGLTRAREINPLNTDHTANIARLYRTWGEMGSEPDLRVARIGTAVEFYVRASELSPHNAQLLNERGQALTLLGRLDEARVVYQKSSEMDTQFVQTPILFGDLYLVEQDWGNAIAQYERAVALEPNAIQAWSALGYAYSQNQEWQKAIDANAKVIEVLPDDYPTVKNMAILFNQTGQVEKALEFAQRALELAPEGEKAVVENFVLQLQGVVVQGGQ